MTAAINIFRRLTSCARESWERFLWEADDWLPERWRFFELPASVVASADFRVLRRVFVFDLLLAEVPDVYFFCSGI